MWRTGGKTWSVHACVMLVVTMSGWPWIYLYYHDCRPRLFTLLGNNSFISRSVIRWGAISWSDSQLAVCYKEQIGDFPTVGSIRMHRW